MRNIPVYYQYNHLLYLCFRSPFCQLPAEMWNMVFATLGKCHLQICSEVCREFYELTESILWRDTEFDVSGMPIARFSHIKNKPIKNLVLVLPLNTTSRDVTQLLGVISSMQSVESLKI